MPLPLHEIEGNGGVFSTLSAYLVNPPRNGEPIGRPSIGFGYINMGYGRDLGADDVDGNALGTPRTGVRV